MTVSIIPSRPDSGDDIETATPTETSTETLTSEPSATETSEPIQTPEVELTVTVIEITPEVTLEVITPASADPDDKPLPTVEATREGAPEVLTPTPTETPTPTSAPEQESTPSSVR